MQTTTKAARLGARLEGLGRRHRELEMRIASVESRPLPDQIALARLKREKLRVRDEMECYEGVLRAVTQTLPGCTAAE